MKFAQITIFCFFLLGSRGYGQEFRGLWVDAFGEGFRNKKEVEQLVKSCRENNFNALFVEIRKRGDAYYFPEAPNSDPRTTSISAEFDALAEIIKQSHTGKPRIEVHCWMVSHFVWAWKNPPDQPTHVFNAHPEYLTKDSIGQKLIAKGYYLDPGNPDANQTIYNAAIDVVKRYDVDGLHWDYFRYPTRDSGYNEVAIKRYKDEFGIQKDPAPSDAKFSEWRRRQLTDFARWVNADMLEIKPKLVISAAVFSNYTDSRNYRFQDWVAWNKEGILDVTIPMDFSPDMDSVFKPRADFAILNQGARAIYNGQGAYLNTPEKTLEQLLYCREKGFKGTVFYSYRNPSTNEKKQAEGLKNIRDSYQPEWSAVPELPWKSKPTKSIVKGTVTDAKGAPIYNAIVKIGDLEQRTEPHGKFAFFEVKPGNQTLQVHTISGATDNKEFSVKAGEVLNINVSTAKGKLASDFKSKL